MDSAYLADVDLDVVGLDAVVLLEEVGRNNCNAGGIVGGSMDDSC